MADPTDTGGSYASPPCFMHEVDPAYTGLADPQQARDVTRWRKAERERLIAARLALSVEERMVNAAAIARCLDTLIEFAPTTVVSLYWPFRGEPDLRPWMSEAYRRGARVALPVVVAKAQPLEFREWSPEARLERGVWNIPFPADGAKVIPSVVIAPLVGFDPECYRLGYGGGFFDRTLAALRRKPVLIGVGHPICAIPTIFPQPFDVPMDWIVTGEGEPKQRGALSEPRVPG